MKVKSDWFTVEEIDNRTFAISEYGHWEQVHSYLFIGQDIAVLIDTGIGIDNIKEITDQLTTLPIKVITSHVHWDHIGSHKYFHEIYVHEYESNWLIDGIPGLPIEEIRYNVGRDISIPVPKNFKITDYEPYTGTPTGILNDNEDINLGDRILSVIHTPGHSPGHICVYEKQTGYLFTGDLVYKGTLYAFYPTTNPQDFVSSVKKVSQIEFVTRLLPSHNELNLGKDFLLRVNDACQKLDRLGLAVHGSGVNKFEDFEIYF